MAGVELQQCNKEPDNEHVAASQQEQQVHFQRNWPNKKVLMGLGVTEIILGCLSVILGSVIVSSDFSFFYSDYTLSSEGIWCGVFLIITGVLGVIAAKCNPSVCMYISNITLSLITACTMTILASFSTRSALITSRGPYGDDPTAAVFYTVMAVIGFVGLVICVAHVVFCCCCRSAASGVKTTFPAN